MSPFGFEPGPWNRRGMPHDTKFSPGIDIIVTASLSLSLLVLFKLLAKSVQRGEKQRGTIQMLVSYYYALRFLPAIEPCAGVD